MRTTNVHPGAVAGGMRGTKSAELVALHPRPSLGLVILRNLFRLLGLLLVGMARHPVTTAACTLVFTTWLVAGIVGVVGLVATGGRNAGAVASPAAGLATAGSWCRAGAPRWCTGDAGNRPWSPAGWRCRPRIGSTCPRSAASSPMSSATGCWWTCCRASAQTTSTPTCRSWRTPSQPAAAASVSTSRAGSGWTSPASTRSPPPSLRWNPASRSTCEHSAVGRQEDGQPWLVRLQQSHLLIAGATDSGKSSLMWSLIGAMGPAIRDGSVQLWAMDPKGGMELTPGAGLFHRFAYESPAAMVELLEEAVAFMRQRAERLRQAGQRAHTPTPAIRWSWCWWTRWPR